MTTSAHRPGRCVALRPVRERGGAALERAAPRRAPHDHHLLFAPEPALGYLRALIAELGLEKLITSVEFPPWESLAKSARQRIRDSGPFVRIHCVLEWDGRDAERLRSDWELFAEELFVEAGVRPRLICCRPVFELWILLHYESVSASCDEGSWIRERVGGECSAEGLFARTSASLGIAVRRAQELARMRYAIDGDDTFPATPGTHLHELIVSWHKLARRVIV
ncbi:MAG: hypothetical protein HQM00_16580 [Magnetococcales bacterium]|nr:hypothetical protein [Magnetococcales bacterium]